MFNTPVQHISVLKPIFHPVFFIPSEENLRYPFMCVHIYIYIRIYIYIYIYKQKCVRVCSMITRTENLLEGISLNKYLLRVNYFN